MKKFTEWLRVYRENESKYTKWAQLFDVLVLANLMVNGYQLLQEGGNVSFVGLLSLPVAAVGWLIFTVLDVRARRKNAENKYS